MKIFVALLAFFATSQAATIVPVDSSVVNVKSAHAGQDYSYSIHENHGFAVNPPVPIHPGISVLKVGADLPAGTTVHGSEQHIVHHEQHEIRPQTIAKTAPIVSEHSISVGSYPTSNVLSYVPASPYQYTYPLGYPYNVLVYKVA